MWEKEINFLHERTLSFLSFLACDLSKNFLTALQPATLINMYRILNVLKTIQNQLLFVMAAKHLVLRRVGKY